MISVADALNRLLALASPLSVEAIPLAQAAGRVLAQDAVSTRMQPPFAAAAMDGYAVMGESAQLGDVFRVIGFSQAGKAFGGSVGKGEAVRIFTGAPVPEGADRIIIQEDVSREGDLITLLPHLEAAKHIRAAGADFGVGHVMPSGQSLRPADIALLAAMNIPMPVVYKQPVVALIATGDELALPGEVLEAHQISSSNSYGLKAIAESAGAQVRLLPIARDTRDSLRDVIALAAGADVIVTIGGASVGDHDLVSSVTEELGVERAFQKVAMRPGKPLMSGRMGDSIFIGLPGNPVAAMVCGYLYLLPLLKRLQGQSDVAPQLHQATLANPLAANGPRAHYMRAQLTKSEARPIISASERQDSGFLAPFAAANVLLVRAPFAPPAEAGDVVDYLEL